MFNRSKPQPPGPGQESVWDYPRPPRAELSSKHVRVIFNGEVIAETTRAVRILETSHPPVYYIPQADVRMDYLTRTSRQTVCEFKGAASYWTICVGDRVAADAAWSYAHPLPGYESIRYAIAFYPSRMEACTVDGERVQPQEGDFYGGWITSDIVGPFKGGPGTWGW
jgi:uncharacterized protein (DUF427 family)